MTEDIVDRIEAALEGVTHWPWGWDTWEDGQHIVTSGGWDLAYIVERPPQMGGAEERKPTMQLIAAAPQLLAEASDEIYHLQHTVTYLEATVAQLKREIRERDEPLGGPL